MDSDHRRLLTNPVIKLRVMQNTGTWIDKQLSASREAILCAVRKYGHNLLFSCVTCFTLKFKG